MKRKVLLYLVGLAIVLVIMAMDCRVVVVTPSVSPSDATATYGAAEFKKQLEAMTEEAK